MIKFRQLFILISGLACCISAVAQPAESENGPAAAAAPAALILPLVSNVQVYTSEAAFIAAVAAHNLETFESETPAAFGTSAVISGVSYDSSPTSQLELRDSVGPFGAGNTTPGGMNFLHADSEVGSFHDPLFITSTVGPMAAFGANFTDLDFGTIQFFVDGDLVHQPSPAGDGATTFVGFIANGGFFFEEIELQVNDRTYGIDDVRTAQFVTVPVPATGTWSLLFLVLMLAGAGFVMTRRSQVIN